MSDRKPTRDELHDGSRTFIRPERLPLPVTTHSILAAVAAKRDEMNRQRLLDGKSSSMERDPRDLFAHAESICAVVRASGEQPSMEQAVAACAVLLDAALAVARVEDQASHLGDAAA